MSKCTRRRFLAGTLALSTSSLLLGAKKPITPSAVFDKRIQEFMNDRGVPGGALAVVKDRRLVYARGYGWADAERKIAATPESLFRIASLSKPITGVAVLKLVEQNKVTIDQRVFDILALDAQVPAGTNLDERWRRITLSQLLHHTGGWDRARHAGDPTFLAKEYLAKRFPDLPPGSPWAIVRFQLAQPLDFEPGTRFAYSGFGYCLLGRIIEKVTGQSYEAFVRQSVLTPAHIRRMRLGRSVERAPGEVQYYDEHDEHAPSNINVEAMDAGGGWIGSVVDLGRFAAALDDPRRSPILKRSTFASMYAPAFPPAPRTDGTVDDAYYSCGWCVRPLGQKAKANYWHYGDMPGTDALLVRFANGFSMAVLLNQRSNNRTLADSDMDATLKRAATDVTEWPAENLFSRFS